MNSIHELTDITWDEYLQQATRPLMVMFYTHDCPHCFLMSPHFERYAKEFEGKVDFIKVNIAENQTIMMRYGVMGTPTFAFFCEGHSIRMVAGEMYPALIKKFVEDSIQSSAQCARNTTWIDVGITGYA
jgi:thioredoxin 1